MKTFNKFNAPLLAIVLIALSLRLLAITIYGDFWFDEMFSFVYSQKPLLTSLKFWTWETNPPLHLLVLKLWFTIFPTNELWARIPSLIFGTLSVWCLYNFVIKIFSKPTALIAALLLALHPYHIFISATARCYALLVLLSILSINYFFRVFVGQDNRPKGIILLAIFNLLVAYTHLTACLLIFCQLFIALLINKKNWIRFLKINIVPLLLWMAWAIPSFTAKINSNLFANAWFFNIKTSLAQTVSNTTVVFFGPTPPKFIMVITLLILLILAMIIYQHRNERWTNITNLNYILVLFLVPTLFVATQGLWNARFLTIIIAPFLIILSYILTRLTKSRVLLFIGVITIMLPGLLCEFSYSFPISDWTVINTYIKQGTAPDKKQIFIYNLYAYKILFDFYYHQPITTLAYQANTITDWDEAVIKNNYIRFKHSNQEIDNWIKTVANDQYDEIFILQNEYVGIDLRSAMKQRGWKPKNSPVYPRSNEPLTLQLYVKN